jgi:hypothetical protein
MPNSLNLRAGRNAALVLALTAVLAACGGGGGGGRRDGDGGGDGGGGGGPQPPAVMGDTFAVTTANRLVLFNRSSGGTQSARAITGLMTGDTLIGFDIRPANGSLIAVANSGRIYTINSMTGAAAVLSTISPMDALSAVTGATAVGVDFNPVPDRLRIITASGKNLLVNVDTGVTTIDGDLTFNGSTATGVVGAGYTNKVATACGTQLFYLDAMNNRLLTTADPNGSSLSVVGNLGVTTSGTKSGFEIISAANGSTSAFVVLTVGGAPTVYSLNTRTGAVSGAQPIQGLTSGENIVGISATPLTNVATTAGELIGLTSNNALFSFNSSAPTRVCSGPTSITGLASGENVVGIDVRPADQNLYAVSVTAAGAGRVLQIDRATGAISAARAIVTEGGAAFTLTGSNFGIAFNPAVDLLRVVSDGTTNNNLRIDVTTGVVQNGAMGGDTPIDPAAAVLSAAAYTNSFGPARPAATKLYTIDATAAALNVQNPPNTGAQVRAAPLTVPATTMGAPAVPIGTIAGVRGFDINGADNTAFAGLSVGAMATNTTLYKVNLDSGLSILLGVIGAGTGSTPLISGTLRGITLNTVPQATIFGVTADIRLVSFKESSTGTLDVNVPITGLANGEDIKAIDVRPANGVIYAFTNLGATYILDPTTGALSGRVAFTAAQPPLVPVPDSFTTTNGLTPGADFDPVVDRLRLIDDPGTMLSNNLRIDVLNGATITDRNLNVGVKVTGAAYSTTTLYTIDTASDRLNMQMPPNDGVQVDVGALRLAGGVRVDATDASGFDIAGSNNFAVAVLATKASPGIAARPATVFTVDLATGTLMPVGAIDLEPGSAVTGLALPITPGAADGNITATALVDGLSLAQFVVNTPGTVTSTGDITGLQTGETLVGIDFRPSDGNLYGLGTSNRLYTIDTNTGVATQKGMALTTPLDAMASNVGFDFDPGADLLRILSDTRQNLRINPTTGVGVGINMGVDAQLVRGGPQPIQTFAAAHTNSFGVPDANRVTQLFVLDAEANSLELQDASNNGMLVLRGRLSTGMAPVRFTGAGELDIAGGDNGLPLAALQPTGSMQSNLYRIDLATGLATQVGTMPIGPAGTQPLVGLTIVIR